MYISRVIRIFKISMSTNNVADKSVMNRNSCTVSSRYLGRFWFQREFAQTRAREAGFSRLDRNRKRIGTHRLRGLV